MSHKVRKHKMRESAQDRAFTIILYALTALLTLICLYPIYFTVIASFSDPYSVYGGKVNLWPVGFSLDAYTMVFENSEIWLGYANTVFYTVAGTLFNLLLTIPSAYALSKKRMFGRGLLTGLFLFTMYFSGGMIPTYVMVKNLGLVNTRWVLVLMGGLSVYNVIVTRVYFSSNIPEALYEAARIDGASELRIFGQLALPLSGPIVAVIALYYAVGHWNDYFTALIYATKKDYQPLSLVLRRLLIQNEAAYLGTMSDPNATEEMLAMALQRTYTAAAMKYSLVFISSAPMLIAYPFVQKFFVKGMMIGSLKG